MTTNYKLSNGNDIDSVLLPRAGNSDTGSLVIYGNTAYQNGAMLGVYGKSHSTRPGQVLLSASTGSDATTDVVIKPGDGLYVSGKKVLVDGDSAGSGTSAYKIPFGTCTTSSTVAEKIATITNGVPFSLEPGSVVAIKFSHEPEKFTTLNVNSSGAKGIKTHFLYGEADDTMLNIFLSLTQANNVFVFVFDGTYWNFVTAYGAGEIIGIT